MLVVLIITPEHQDKTVVHLGQGTCKKGIDALLAWLINAAKKFLNPDLTLVIAIIIN